MKISVFGVGYVGLVTGACLANLGHEILCVDVESEKIKLLREGKIPFYEPGLKELVLANQPKGRLTFTLSPREGVNFGEVIFNCVGTPENVDHSANLKYVFSVAESVAQFAEGKKFLINKSTVPPGTARKCDQLIKKRNPSAHIEVVSNPEFLAEGKAVYDFTHPDKIVVGAENEEAYPLLKKIYTGRVRTYIPLLETDWETAEMIKYANNSFLATKISFVNEIANVCDQIGADVKVVAQALGMDYRINPRFFNAGVGYGGSCFPKDVRALINTAKERGYSAELLKVVDELNERQKKIIIKKITSHFGGNLRERIFTIWGLSFKPQTSDMREASSLVIIPELLKLGAQVKVYDPVAKEEAQPLLGDKVVYCSSAEEAAKESSGIILVTEWDEFRNVNFAELGKIVKEKVLFDGRNIYEPAIVREEGWDYYGVGRK